MVLYGVYLYVAIFGETYIQKLVGGGGVNAGGLDPPGDGWGDTSGRERESKSSLLLGEEGVGGGGKGEEA
jgi:hypothetical protein